MIVGVPPIPFAPPALTVTTPRGQVAMTAAWSTWCHAAADLPAELRAGEDPVCWRYTPPPALPYNPPPYEWCRASLEPSFTTRVRPGEPVEISGTIGPLGTVEAEFAQNGVALQRGPGLTWTARGAGATAVTLRTSGVHGAAVYTATVGVVRDIRPPAVRVDVRHDLGRIELTLARRARVRVCAEPLDGTTPRDLGLRQAGLVTVPLVAGNRRVLLGLTSPEGVAAESIEVRLLDPPARPLPPAVTMRSADGTAVMERRWGPWCLRRGAGAPWECTYHPGWISPDIETEARCVAALEPLPGLVVAPGSRIRFGPVSRRLGAAVVTVTRGATRVDRGPLRPWTADLRGRYAVEIETDGRAGRVFHRAEVVATDDPRPPRATVVVRGRVAQITLTRPTRVSACFVGGARESAKPARLGLIGPGVVRVALPPGTRSLRLGLRTRDGLSAPPVKIPVPLPT